jgi:hypothetical protein
MKSISQKIIMVCLLVLTQISLSKVINYQITLLLISKRPYHFPDEQHDVPVISVSALIPAGAINDKDKSGLASLTATALKHGTKNFTSKVR